MRCISALSRTLFCWLKFDNVIQIAGSGDLEGFETEIIQDKQIRPEIEFEAALQAVVSPTAVEMLEQFVGVDKQDIITPPARFMAQRLGKMTFSDASRAA